MKMELEPGDYQEIRNVVDTNIDFVPTDEQIDQIMADPIDGSYLTGMGYAWAWGDTEVRDLLCAALRKLEADES